MAVQPTDTYIVNRGGTNYKVPAADIGSKLQPSDFMLVNRSGTNYKVTGADLTNQLYSSQSPCAQGGIVVKHRSNWYHIFYESGVLKLNNPINNFGIYAFGGGGGGGSQTGGGGGGGAVSSHSVSVLPGPRNMTVTIGAGGAGGPYPGASNGQNGGTTQVTNYPQTISAGGGGGGGGGSSPGVSQPTGTGGGGGGNTTSSTPSGGIGRPTWPVNGYGGNGHHLAGGGGGGYLAVPSGGVPGNNKNAPTLANAGNNGFNSANQPYIRAGDGGRGGVFLPSNAGFGAGGGGGRNGPYVGYGGGHYPPQYSDTYISGGHGKSPLTPLYPIKVEASNGEIYTASGGGGGAQQNKGGNGSGGVVIFFYNRPVNISNAPSTLRENPNIN